MNSAFADFIERHSETIIEHAIAFAKTVDVGTPMDDVALRDHLPEIVAGDRGGPANAADARRGNREVRGPRAGADRAPALRRGDARAASRPQRIQHLQPGVGVPRLARVRVAPVGRRSPTRPPTLPRRSPASTKRSTRRSPSRLAITRMEVERWRNIFLGVLGHDLRSPLSAIVMTSELIARMAVDAPIANALRND